MPKGHCCFHRCVINSASKALSGDGERKHHSLCHCCSSQPRSAPPSPAPKLTSLCTPGTDQLPKSNFSHLGSERCIKQGARRPPFCKSGSLHKCQVLSWIAFIINFYMHSHTIRWILQLSIEDLTTPSRSTPQSLPLHEGKYYYSLFSQGKEKSQKEEMYKSRFPDSVLLYRIH